MSRRTRALHTGLLYLHHRQDPAQCVALTSAPSYGDLASVAYSGSSSPRPSSSITIRTNRRYIYRPGTDFPLLPAGASGSCFVPRCSLCILPTVSMQCTCVRMDFPTRPAIICARSATLVLNEIILQYYTTRRELRTRFYLVVGKGRYVDGCSGCKTKGTW